MLRVKHCLLIAAWLIAISGTSPAAFVLVGPSSGTVTVNPSSPGSPPGNTTVATGIVSANNFVTWNGIGADSVPLLSNILTGVVSTQGTAIAAVTLVSGSPTNPTMTSPPPLPVSGSSNMSRRTTGFSFSGDFSGNEALLFANAAGGALIIDFAVPVTAAGFRIQSENVGTNNTFFLQAYNEDGLGGFAAASSFFGGQSVTSSTFTPGSDSAPFYGISADAGETFTRLWLGFGSGTPFAISTLEIGATGGPPPSAVPLPPTLFAALIGAAGLAAFRRRRKA